MISFTPLLSIVFFLSFVVLAFCCLYLCSSGGLKRIGWAGVTFGYAYWYVLPGSLFMYFGDLGGADRQLLDESLLLSYATLITLASYLFCIVGVSLALPNRSSTVPPTQARPEFPVAFPLGCFVMSCVLLMWAFWEQGLSTMLAIILLNDSAREFMTFENTSQAVSSSIRALMQICVIFFALITAASSILKRGTMSIAFMLSMLTLITVFLSTGTRAILLHLAIIAFISFIFRSKGLSLPGKIVGKISKLPLLVGNVALLAVCYLGIVARFGESQIEMSSFILQVIASNNDMFRELVFSIALDRLYPGSVFDFSLTPISFALPSFLGFTKSIPEHLVQFNLQRSGIDLVFGEGNVFPGIIADFYLIFGALSMLPLGAFTFIFFKIVYLAVRSLPSIESMAIFIVLLSYYFISIRNIHGGIGILIFLIFSFSLIKKGKG